MSTGEAKPEGRVAEFAAFGPFRLFPATRRLERDEKPVEIGDRALDVLIELVTRAGQVVSKTELMASVWGNTTVVEGALRTHVYNLRRTLGDGVGGARYVTSVAGRGYCFVAPVIRAEVEAASSGVLSALKFAHGLPPRLARMAGRDEAVQTLTARLLAHRFVTILGAAGIGKTTVAVALAHALLDHFDDAVRFVELGALTDPSLVAATVASTLGVPIQTDDPLESLRAFLQDKQLLLVLDNCEHVVEAAAKLAEHLFLLAPRVHLLATSREGLRVEGEHIYHLAPLETPIEHGGLNADTVQTFPAVRVFLERAAASGWSGDLNDNDVPIVVETCRRLDGVPLALELSASFVAEFGLQGMAAVLDDRLRLLWQRGRRTAPPRQQTLHALVAWSYDRLRERERIVLRRLSVFVGAFPFDAAKAIVREPTDSDESLAENMHELVAKSLLSASAESGAVVYRLLETTRVYALEQLAESGDLERVSLRHAQLFAERLERAPHVGGWTSDLGNVRAALTWCFSSPAGHEAGTRLAAAAARMLLELGLVSECLHWSRRALDVLNARDAGTLVELALQEALANSAMFARGLDDEVLRALNRGVRLARMLGGGDHEVRLLAHLTFFVIAAGDYKRGLELAQENGVAARLASTEGKIMAECWLGVAYSACGHQTLARKHCEESLNLKATLNGARTMPLNMSLSILNYARVLWLQGEPDRAATVAQQAIDEAATLSDAAAKCIRFAYSEMIFAWRGEWDEADRLIERLAELVDRYSLAAYRGLMMGLRGELLVKTGRPHEGCDLLRTANATLKAAGNTALDTTFAAAFAEGLSATGTVAEALLTVEAAIELAQSRGGTWDLPDLLRLKGVILALQLPTGAPVVAETLSSAIELARRQGALAWELRATTALARERSRPGGSVDGLRDLAAVYGRFTEGFETLDLRTARMLLDRRC
jgi:predicted ATPase